MKQENKTYQAWVKKHGRIGWQLEELSCKSKEEFIKYWKDKKASVREPIIEKGQPIPKGY